VLGLKFSPQLNLSITLSLDRSIYTYSQSNYHYHHSWYVSLTCQRSLLVLVLVYRTVPCSSLYLLTLYLLVFYLLRVLVGIFRRLVLSNPLLVPNVIIFLILGAFNVALTPYLFHAFFIRLSSNKNVDHWLCDAPSTCIVTVFIFLSF